MFDGNSINDDYDFLTATDKHHSFENRASPKQPSNIWARSFALINLWTLTVSVVASLRLCLCSNGRPFQKPLRPRKDQLALEMARARHDRA